MNSREAIEKGKIDERPFFRLDDPADEPLNEEIRLSIYNDVSENSGRPKKTKEDEEWDLHMKCTQEWFVRCSWINKFLFLEGLSKSASELFVLETVLKGIESISSKDVVESLAHNLSNYDYDRIPVDDNRTLNMNQLQAFMDADYLWFSKSVPSRQISIILRLLRLGGGGLVYQIYKVIDKLYKERKVIESQSLMAINSTTGKQIEERKPKTKGQSKSTVGKLSADVESSESRVNSLDEFTRRKMKQLERREEILTEYKKMRGILTETKKNVKKVDVKETVDYMQILPIWLNRRIISHIDEKTLSGFKKVGKYWGKIIDDYMNEKSGRKAINGKIDKIIGTRPGKEVERKEEKDENEDIEFVLELGRKELLKRKNIPEKAVDSYLEEYKTRFSKKFTVTPIESSVCYERCCKLNAAVGMLAASTSNNIIQFYSVRTGKRLNFTVFGLESTITCLALHEDNTHIFVGCKNGSLIAKDIRTSKTMRSFGGHSNAIKWLYPASTNLLSASRDGIIRDFQLWSGVCLLCIDLSLEWTVSSLLVWNEKSSLCIIGTQEGVLVLVDVESKKFLRRVKLHNAEITQLGHDEQLLITGSENGKIRVWDVTQLDNNNNNNNDVLNPFYDVNVGSRVTSLILYNNLIFSGCENGTIKIISLYNGLILKTMKISTETPVLGLTITEDKVSMKMIIWHEGGIEMRGFSLRKTAQLEKSINKDCLNGRNKTFKDFNNKTQRSEDLLNETVNTNQRLIEAKPNICKVRKPFEERNSRLRRRRKDVDSYREDVITKFLKSAVRPDT